MANDVSGGMVSYSVRVPWTARDALRTHRKAARKSWPYAAGGAVLGAGATLLIRRAARMPVFVRRRGLDALSGAGAGAALFGGTAHGVVYHQKKRREIVDRAWGSLMRHVQGQKKS